MKNKPAKINRIINYLTLTALLAIGVWIRLRFIDVVHLYPDEFVTLLAVKMIGEKGLPVMPSGLFYEHGLLFSYIASFVATLFEPSHLAARYTSLFFGLLTMGLTFFIGRRWFSPAVGLMAVAGLAVAPAAIHWSGRARMYALLQFLVMLTIWLAYQGVIHNKSSWRWLAILTYLGAVLTHFVAITLAPPIVLAIFILWQVQNKGAVDLRSLFRIRPKWLELAALGGVLIIAFMVKRAGQPKGIEPMEAANSLSGIAQVFTIYSDFSFDLPGGWLAISPFYLELPALIFLPFALLALSTTAYRFTKRYYLPSLPALFLIVTLLTTTFEMILAVSADRRDDKYLFMLLPVLLLLGAYGLELAISYLLLIFKSTQPAIHSLFIISVVLSILFITKPETEALLANTGDDYNTAFTYILKHWQPGDKILTGTPAAAAFYLNRNDFYSVQKRGGYDYRILNINGKAVDRWLASPTIRTEAELHKTMSDNNVWLLLERWGLRYEYYDLSFQQQLLAQTDYINYDNEAQGIFILRSKLNPRPLIPDPARFFLNATFSNIIQLIGYTVEPEQAILGQEVRLTLYWQALSRIPSDYTVFIHLRRPEGGGNVAQADHRPLGSIYPTSIWPVYQTIRESSNLFIPPDLPPGSYELWGGLYLLETGERLPVLRNDSSGENAVMMGTITVLRNEK